MSPLTASSNGFKQSEAAQPQTFGKGYIPPDTPAGKTAASLQGKYKNIAPYLAVVSAASSNSGIDPNFQAAVLAVENGGWSKWNPKAVSRAGAQGIAQFMPGTWRQYGKGGDPFNPSDAIPASARLLAALLKQHKGNFSEAAQSYNGGSYRDAGTRDYASKVQAYMTEVKADRVFTPGVKGKDLFDPLDPTKFLDPAKDALGLASEALQILLSPKKQGELLAKVIAYLVKFIGKAIWEYVIAPLFHWHQRAAIYYYETVMSGKAGSGYYYTTAGIVTISFWATGYAILWASVEDGPSLIAKPSDTPLGRMINGTRTAKARRKLTPPGKVSEETPPKPEPVPSAAQMVRVSTLSVARGRSITVNRRGNSERPNTAPATA